MRLFSAVNSRTADPLARFAPGRGPLARFGAVALAVLLAVCAPDDDTPSTEEAGEAMSAAAAPSPLAERCAPDDDGLTLLDGFCAIVYHEGVGPARHLDVREDGDVFVALRNRRRRGGEAQRGGVTVLRDADGDGAADTEESWGVNGGTGVLVDGETVYFAPNDAVLRYTVPVGSMAPTAGPDTVVSGLPDTRNHTAKTLALGPDGSLYVNIGAPSNTCMEESRTRGSQGIDPCPELETRAGIWRFDAEATGQTQADGERFATGLRNVVALRMHPETGVLYGAQHGRDQLHDMFPDLFTVEDNAEKPAEEFVRLERGDDFGWPYCYYDPLTDTKVLAPEYGGDGSEVGRCADKKDPIIGFPGHWGPNDLEFYTGDGSTQFPARYRGGAFIAFHGSWNRAPLPQEGYNVVFVRFEDGEATTEWDVFADGFRPDPQAEDVEGEAETPEGDAEAGAGAQEAGEEAPSRPPARPVGVAVGPDGSLYVADSLNGRIWRIVWAGTGM